MVRSTSPCLLIRRKGVLAKSGTAIADDGMGMMSVANEKKPSIYDTGLLKQKHFAAYGLLAVGNGQAACGFRVV